VRNAAVEMTKKYFHESYHNAEVSFIYIALRITVYYIASQT